MHFSGFTWQSVSFHNRSCTRHTVITKQEHSRNWNLKSQWKMHLPLLMERVGIIKQKNRACFECVYSANSERGEAATFSSTKYDSMVDVVTKAMEFMLEKNENISSIQERRKIAKFSFERVLWHHSDSSGFNGCLSSACKTKNDSDGWKEFLNNPPLVKARPSEAIFEMLVISSWLYNMESLSVTFPRILNWIVKVLKILTCWSS